MTTTHHHPTDPDQVSVGFYVDGGLVSQMTATEAAAQIRTYVDTELDLDALLVVRGQMIRAGFRSWVTLGRPDVKPPAIRLA